MMKNKKLAALLGLLLAGVEVEILVTRSRETISACVRATTKSVDGEAERQRRLFGHLVERALAEHLVKRDSLELGSLHGANQPGSFESG